MGFRKYGGGSGGDSDGDTVGGGNYLDPSTWSNVSTASAATVGRIENILGELHETIVTHHEGHGKRVGNNNTAGDSPGNWLHLNDDLFKGFHSNLVSVNALITPVTPLINGWFFFNTTVNRFEVYRTAPSPRWVNHNPFASGGVWNTRVLSGGGAAQTLNYLGVVGSRLQAFNATTSARDGFADLSTQTVILTNFLLPATAGYEQYSRVPYHPTTYRGNPRAYFWGVAQTERWPSGYPNPLATAGTRLLRFENDEADEEFNGWGGLDVFGIFLGTSSGYPTDLDGYLGTWVEATHKNTVFKMPSGVYNVTLTLGLNRNDPDVSARFKKVLSGRDDNILHSSSGWSVLTSEGPEIFAGVQVLDYKDLVVRSPDRFYFDFTGADAATRTKAFLRIERVG